MKYWVLFILLITSLTFAQEMWRFDVAGILEFPIAARNSTLGNDFTSIVGGGVDGHYWFSEHWGVGAHFSADYLSNLDDDIDLTLLTPTGSVAWRRVFNERGVISAELYGGITSLFFRSRGDTTFADEKGPVWGGSLALPMVSRLEKIRVGPYASIHFAYLDENEIKMTELFLAIGVKFGLFAGEL